MTKSSITTRLAATALCLASVGCAGRAQPGVVEPGVEARAIEQTRIERSSRIVFDWSLRDGAAHFSGSGAARVEADPPRARLDLFGPQDQQYLAAVLAGDVLRLPPNVPDDVVPPAPLLWSVLGVIRPPEGARLLSAVEKGADGGIDLVYGDDTGDWSYHVRHGRLAAAEWIARSGGGKHTVELTAGEAEAPARSVYRDWQATRELTLQLERQDYVDGFPADTWSLGRGR